MKILRHTSLFLFVLLLSTSQAFSQEKENEPGDQAPLPGFSVELTSSKTLNPEGLVKGKPVIVIYFDPDCDHCQKQATWIRERIAEFKNINLLFISWGEMEAIKNFETTYFEDYSSPMLRFSKDTKYMIDKWFGYSEVPSVYVYNKDWKRVYTFRNETPVDQLLKYAK